jgi:hypothetical protein
VHRNHAEDAPGERKGGQNVRSWEPLEGELRGQGKAWRAFKVFRDMPERSLKGAATIFYGRSEEGSTRSQYDQFKRWSARFAWHERVHSHDAWIEMVQRSAIEEHARAKAEDHAKRETALREKSLELRELAADQALKMLSYPLTEQRMVEESEDGTRQTFIFTPASWSKNTAVALYSMAVGTEKPPEADSDDVDFSAWSDEHLNEYLRLTQKARLGQRRSGRPGG